MLFFRYTHVRTKFKYAFDQGLDEQTRYFLEQIAWLYSQERKYQMQNLSPEEIRQTLNSDETNRVIAELRKRLDYHLYFDKEPKGDLMQKALNYLHSFGNHCSVIVVMGIIQSIILWPNEVSVR